MIARPAARRLAGPVRPGFTLVEVMVVVSILVILAGLATFAVVRTMNEARVNETKLKMQKIEQACKTYYTANGQWPQAISELISPENGLPPRLEGGQSAITDAWGHPINYTVTPDQYGSERAVMTANGPNGVIQWPDR